MMLIKKTENQKNENNLINKIKNLINNLITNTLSNQNILNNNHKKNNVNICSSFRQNNGLGTSKLQNTISFGNNVLSKTNMSGLYNAKKLSHKENINSIY